LVNEVYATPEAYPGPVLILATLFFAFQIYCDFSGYSDIAIGTARIMGFELMQNFRSPYFAKSITEFWQRWHISLSTWFRDYVYIPLGGNRGSPGRTNLNLLVVFLLSGIWHGAEWSFVLWGAFHGVLLIAERFSRSAMRSLNLSSRLLVGVNALRPLLCFALVCLSWVFFRAETAPQAFYIYGHMFEGWHVLSDLRSFFQSLPATYAPGHLLISVCALTLLVSIEYQIKETSFCKWLETKSTVTRWLVYYVLFLAILLFREHGSQEFIYFQF
jgi:alginate O-acetyltransferase complex protein AlgI